MARSSTCPPIYSWCSRVGSPNSACSCRRRAHTSRGGWGGGGRRAGGEPSPQRTIKKESYNSSISAFRAGRRGPCPLPLPLPSRDAPPFLLCHHLRTALGVQPPRKAPHASRVGGGSVGRCPPPPRSSTEGSRARGEDASDTGRRLSPARPAGGRRGAPLHGLPRRGAGAGDPRRRSFPCRWSSCPSGTWITTARRSA